jgi:hypothetical protein
MPLGSCAFEADASASRACYGTGVQVTVTPTFGNLTTPNLSMKVSKPDGKTPCYSVDFGANLPGGGRGFIFRDAGGVQLARGVLNANGLISLTCEAGTTPLLDSSCIPPPAPPFACQPGVCK